MTKRKTIKNPNATEIIELTSRIKDGSTSADAPLGEVLRLCMRLGKLLGNEDLVNWARMEVSGYVKAEDLPDYRKMSSESRGIFYGPFGSGIKNAHIPSGIIEKEHREVLYNVYLFQPVTELEDLAISKRGEGNLLRIPWSGNMIAHYQRKEIYQNGMVLASAWQVMTQQKLIGVLEVIKTRVLDFILEIEEELGLDSGLTKMTSKVIDSKQERIKQIFHNNIYGGNIMMGDAGSVTQQTINVNQGDIESLKDYLRELGIKEIHVNKLEEAIEEDKTEKQHPGPAVRRWLKKAGEFGASVASNMLGQLLATAVERYYGVNTGSPLSL